MKKLLRYWPAAITMLCLLAFFAYILGQINPFWYYLPQQRQLARELGVNIDDYPAAYAFPDGYFHTILKEGMALGEVHQLVRGYSEVFSCEQWNGEVYFYFSEDASRALRFEIQYDESFRFEELRTEDENSRTISVDGCVAGLLEE